MNKYMSQLAALDWPKVVAIGIGLAVAYYFLMFDNGATIEANIKQANDRMEATKKSLAETEKAMENANQFERQVQTVQKQFDKITEFMPENLSIAELNTIINKNAQESGVRPRIEPKGEDPPSGATQAVRMGIQLDGTFAQIETFLSGISRERRLLVFDGVEIAPQTAAGGGQPNALSILTFKGTLVGYRFLKNAPEPAALANPAQPAQPAPAPAPAAGGT